MLLAGYRFTSSSSHDAQHPRQAYIYIYNILKIIFENDNDDREDDR